jgi:RNA polymerase sigma-70 factor (ECF subfamily)
MMTVEARPERVVDERLGGTTTEREAAFARLVDRDALDHAYRFATLMLGDREEAEDAAHDAALAAWRHLDELREPEHFEAWFARILSNTCRDRLRARGRVRVIHIAPEALTGTSASLGDSAEAVALHQALAGALNELPPDQREVVVLRFFFDLSIEQIAARTGARVGTVKSRLHYALRALRGAFDAAARREEIR